MNTCFRLDVGSLNKPQITRQGYLKADSLPTRAGVFEYRFMDGTVRRELRHPDDVFDSESIDSLQDICVTNDHPTVPLDVQNTKDYSVGHTSGPASKHDDFFIKSTLLITQQKAINDILKSGKEQLSCGYHCEVIDENGIWEGQQYDSRQKNIRYNHIAIVDEGRAGPMAKIKLDSVDAIMSSEKSSGYQDQNMFQLDAKGDSQNKGDIKMAIKFNLDGLEYELQDSLSGLATKMKEKLDNIASLEKDLANLKSENEKLTGKLDGANIELNKKSAELEAAKKAVPSDKEMVKLAKGRMDVEAVAKKVLGDDFNVDELETIELKKKVLEKACPETKLDGRSVDYVDGIFDSLTKSNKLDGNTQLETALGGTVQNTADGIVKNDSKKHIDIYKNAWKSKDGKAA